MKKLYLSVLVLLVVISFFKKSNPIIIPKEAIRFRVIANSNTEEDQKEKLEVKDALEKEVFKDIKNTTNIEDVRTIISSNISKYRNLIENTLTLNNRNTTFTITFGQNYFPKKTYSGIIYNEGNYESLVVSLGEGKGNNWWCVLFPPLCLLEAEETNKDKVEYKFFIKEIIDKYMK